MKLKNIIYTTTLAALMIAAVTGCSKKRFDINANPNDVTDVSVTPSVLLPGAQQYTSSTITSEWWLSAGGWDVVQDQVLTSLSMKRPINLPTIFMLEYGISYAIMPPTTI
jgi:hypothetical protein